MYLVPLHFRNSFCGFVRPDGHDEAAYHGRHNDIISDRSSTPSHKHHIHKRATPSKNTCNLLLVADYKFHNTVGDGSVESTANYLVFLYLRFFEIRCLICLILLDRRTNKLHILGPSSFFSLSPHFQILRNEM